MLQTLPISKQNKQQQGFVFTLVSLYFIYRELVQLKTVLYLNPCVQQESPTRLFASGKVLLLPLFPSIMCFHMFWESFS